MGKDFLKLNNFFFFTKKFLDFVLEPMIPNEPIFLQIEPTTKCNLKCIMCNLTKSKKDMTFEDFKYIITQFKELRFIRFQGIGEPLLNRELIKFIKFSSEKNIKTSIITNGLLIKKPLLRKLNDSGLNHLGISIDSPSKKNYERIRRGGKFKEITKNLETISNMKDELNFNTEIFTVVMEENLSELMNMIDFCERFKINDIFFNLRNELKLTKEIKKTVLEVSKKSKESGINSRILLPINHIKRKCKWPWIGTYVTVEGYVTACCMQSDFNKINFGNIFHKNFESIWKGKEYRNFRYRLKNDIPQFCQRCHRCKTSYF